ncbi:MAG: preprotein translocase subunit SecG [Egibacteraceae bacterium]
MNILTAAIVVAHLIVSVVLILLILMKAGRGGGLSDMFGGGSISGLSGSTLAEKNLDRVTVIVGVIFAMTTIVLALRLV